jgi:hypothetical protein
VIMASGLHLPTFLHLEHTHSLVRLVTFAFFLLYRRVPRHFADVNCPIPVVHLPLRSFWISVSEFWL